jgi:hypothetical protein
MPIRELEFDLFSSHQYTQGRSTNALTSVQIASRSHLTERPDALPHSQSRAENLRRFDHCGKEENVDVNITI